MQKIKPEEIYNDTEFECKRCGKEGIKGSRLEPDYGYVSKVDGSFVGPLCHECIKIIGKDVTQKDVAFETAFVVLVLPEGRGVAISTMDDDTIQYLREAQPFDFISASRAVIDEFIAIKTVEKMAFISNKLGHK